MTPNQKQYRNRLICIIHASAKEQGMSEDVRRDVMQMVIGKSSCSDMNIDQLKAVADHLRDKQGKAANTHNRRYRPESKRDEIRILYGKWGELKALGESCGTPQGLDKWVAKVFKVDSTEWLSAGDAHKACEMLKKWIYRVGTRKKSGRKEDVTGRSGGRVR